MSSSFVRMRSRSSAASTGGFSRRPSTESEWSSTCSPGLESVRTYSFEEKFYRKLFFKDDRLVGAIMIGPPKGRKKLIEIMRSRQRIERPKQELLDPNNLKD